MGGESTSQDYPGAALAACAHCRSSSSCSIEGKLEDLALGSSQTPLQQLVSKLKTQCAWSQVGVLWWPCWCVILSMQTDLSGSPSQLSCDLGGPSAAASTLVCHSPAVIYPYSLLVYSYVPRVPATGQ